MLIKKIFLALFFLIISCKDINFAYKNDLGLSNPIYNKSIVEIRGKEILNSYKYLNVYFGNSENFEYKLDIFVEEIQTKRSVKSNQAVSKVDYELIFSYNLKAVNKGCIINERLISSKFSYTPKSSGYNFGSDQSLKKLYDLAIKDNFRQYVNFLNSNGVLCG